MPNGVKLFLSAVLVSCMCAPSSARVYRWVDENGVTVYSQTPPPAGDWDRLKTRPGPPATDQEAARERLKTRIEESLDAEQERQRAAEEQAKKAEKEAKREQSCNAARQNLETLQNLGTRMVRTPDGRHLRLSEEEVAAKIDEAQRQIKEYCTE